MPLYSELDFGLVHHHQAMSHYSIVKLQHAFKFAEKVVNPCLTGYKIRFPAIKMSV